MNCPKCYSVIDSFTFKEFPVGRCSGCKGLWFRPEVLSELRQESWMADRILDQGNANVGKQYNEVRDILCPECHSAMEPETDPDQKHIIYETCPLGHGVFLDAGELTDLVHKTFWDWFKPAR